MVSLLLDIRANADLKDRCGRTPLSQAARNGYEEVVKLLLAMDEVNINAKDNECQTPLLMAAVNGHKEVVELLLATGKVDVTAKDSG